LFDTDGDDVDDCEESLIGTHSWNSDTDGDGLSDGLECVLWFNPTSANPDGDQYPDLMEYNRGTDPYIFDRNWKVTCSDILAGFIAGDFGENIQDFGVPIDLGSPGYIIGQLISGFLLVGDLRDLTANIFNEDYFWAALSTISMVPVVGDTGSVGAKASKFVIKNAHDASKVTDFLVYLKKHCNGIYQMLENSDEVLKALQRVSGEELLTLARKTYNEIQGILIKKGFGALYSTIDDLPIKNVINVTQDSIWERPPIPRGNLADDFLNHSTPNSLGKYFPVVDRLEIIKEIINGTEVKKGLLVDTKSIDLGAESYRNSKRLRDLLNKYLERLENFEKRMVDNAVSCGDQIVKIGDYDKKVLEIVIPDILITKEQIDVLNNFSNIVKIKNIELWLVIAK
jgi:hypothetical protein